MIDVGTNKNHNSKQRTNLPHRRLVGYHRLRFPLSTRSCVVRKLERDSCPQVESRAEIKGTHSDQRSNQWPTPILHLQSTTQFCILQSTCTTPMLHLQHSYIMVTKSMVKFRQSQCKPIGILHFFCEIIIIMLE